MANVSLTDATVKLAGNAADLSNTIRSLEYGHEATSTDISTIADELNTLSHTLWRLHEALVADPSLYNESFNEDLGEITVELRLVFEEITDCCDELHKADSVPANSVGWMFKKGRVHRLQKHLETLKTTLMVMRTVLWHGKDYGTHNSPGRLAESSPHTMHEDRAILEIVFSRNRNAIVDLHLLDSPGHHQQRSSSSSSTPSAAGTHHRNLSSSTGVDCPPLPDVLPPSTKIERKENKAKKDLSPSRRFSNRGVRLAVHSSILDMDAHKVPSQLKEKWIQKSSRDNAIIRTHMHQISTAGLSNITEVPSMQETVSLKQALIEIPKIEPENISPSLVVECSSEEENIPPKRKASIKKAGNQLGRIMHKLSISQKSSPLDKDEQGNTPSPSKKKLFSKPGLTLKDFEEEFENGV